MNKVLYIILTVFFLSGCGSKGSPPLDDDHDGIENSIDVSPNDASESADTDNDGVGDNSDAFPNDASESTDTDNDGVGDNADAFPNDVLESADTDNDGVGDNTDAFPNDALESADTDNDGVGDNTDAFPNDASESTDTDNDGVGDNADAFPNDPLESADTDNDGIGDNADKPKYKMISTNNVGVVSIGDTYQIGISEIQKISITGQVLDSEIQEPIYDLVIKDDTSSAISINYGNTLDITGLNVGNVSLSLVDPVEENLIHQTIRFKVHNVVNAFEHSYLANNNLQISITSISVTDGGSTWDYSVSYTQYNPTEEIISEAQWMAFPVTGEGKPQYGSFSDLYPQDRKNRTVSYRMLKNNPIKLLQFHSDSFFDRATSKDDGVVWHLNIDNPLDN